MGYLMHLLASISTYVSMRAMHSYYYPFQEGPQSSGNDENGEQQMYRVTEAYPGTQHWMISCGDARNSLQVTRVYHGTVPGV